MPAAAAPAGDQRDDRDADRYRACASDGDAVDDVHDGGGACGHGKRDQIHAADGGESGERQSVCRKDLLCSLLPATRTR